MNHLTYCNPLPLPVTSRGMSAHAWNRENSPLGWDDPALPDYRENADPSVLFHDGRWYLFASCGKEAASVWVSEDFATWRHHSLNIENIGYAPAIVRHRDRFLLTALRPDAKLWAADSPLGPYTLLGQISDGNGDVVAPPWFDPALFSDEDGRLYGYWGCGSITEGVYAVELDAENPVRMLGAPVRLFGYLFDHEWERTGEHHPFDASCIEGPHMTRIAGRYYLIYAAPGTQYRNYGFGCYVGDSPLGPFTYQGRNPILCTTQGLVTGAGHGCITAGPNGTYWAFYTVLARTAHQFERRLGMDPVGFDENGDLFVRGATEAPQWAPGVVADPENGNSTGEVPVTVLQKARASSHAPGRTPFYAIDSCHHTFWQADDGDGQPTLTVRLQQPLEVTSCRVWWREPHLRYDDGRVPGPYGYTVEGRTGESGDWQMLLDAADNTLDLNIDYRRFPSPARVQELRLTVTRAPQGVGVGVTDFTVFAPKGQRAKP